ncbi:craniofacial development protein 2-like [Plakobranchus ocellatus]|uniref:Craniofacial development protein 2-like n=1 Tax=Plakobranchus ocellatus TaxID=259542 RepID=A0AAV4CPD0_9GAST|nr:craniofacial development protein 2-like [Plakobranchus ocellatus]
MSLNHTETLVNNLKGVCDSNPNPSLGRDSHVQQVAPRRHPGSARKIKTDKISKIATWNVRILHQKGKLENIVKEMERMTLIILGLAEARWTGAGSMKLGDSGLGRAPEIEVETKKITSSFRKDSETLSTHRSTCPDSDHIPARTFDSKTGVGGTVACESALRSAGILLSWVLAPP